MSTLEDAAELARVSKQYLNSLVEDYSDAPAYLAKALELATKLSGNSSVDSQPEIKEDVVPVEEAAPTEPVISTNLRLPANRKYVAVKPEDFIDKLTAHGRRLVSVRESFDDLSGAQEYARYATERPIYIGELVREGDDLYTVLKYQFLPNF